MGWRPMKREGRLSNNDLMAACRESGKGGGWEAEAIEQWRWQLANGEGKERVLAWIKLHSIARGSPKCIDEAARPLRVESCAADLGLALQTVLDHCTRLVAEGRMRLKKAHLYYRADVPEKLPEAVPEADSDADENSFVHKNFPAYVVDFYEKLPAENRAAIGPALRQLIAWKPQALAEGVAGLRHEISRVESNTLSALGLPKIVLPKKAAQEPVWFQPMLLGEPDFVHKNNTAAVSRAVNTASLPGVQTGPSLLPFRPDQTEERSPPPSPTETSVSEVVMVASRIEGVNVETAAKLLRNCRAVDPSLRALEVVHLAEGKLRASPGARSPVGLLLKTLAADAVGPPLARAKELARREEERGLQQAQDAAAREAQYRRDAEFTLADPKASDDDLNWAREVLARAKGAGDAG